MNLSALARSSVLYAIGNFATRIVGFLMIPVYTRYLTTADYGLIELIDLVLSVAAIAFGLTAMGSALIRIFHDEKDPSWQRSVVSTAMITMAGGAGVLCVIGVLAAPWIMRVVLGSDEHASLLQATFLTLVASNVDEVGFTYLRLKDRPVQFVVLSLVLLVSTLGLNIVFIVFLHQGVWGFVMSKLLVSALAAVYFIAQTIREAGIRWNGVAFRRMVRFGGPLVVAGLASFVVHFLDRFFLNYNESLSAVGVYALAYKFGFLITHLIAVPFHRAWSANLYAYTDNTAWKADAGNVLRVYAFFLLFGWLGLSALVDEALVVMAAPAFWGAALFAPWLALGYAARAVGDFFRTILFVNKRTGLWTRIGVSCAIFNTVLNALLIPPWGAWGATWATLATWIYFLWIAGYVAQKEHRIPVPYRAIGTMVALAFALYGLSVPLTDAPLAARVAMSLGLAFLFPPLAWWTGCFTPAQKDVVRGAWLRLRRRAA